MSLEICMLCAFEVEFVLCFWGTFWVVFPLISINKIVLETINLRPVVALHELQVAVSIAPKKMEAVTN